MRHIHISLVELCLIFGVSLVFINNTAIYTDTTIVDISARHFAEGPWVHMLTNVTMTQIYIYNKKCSYAIGNCRQANCDNRHLIPDVPTSLGRDIRDMPIACAHTHPDANKRARHIPMYRPVHANKCSHRLIYFPAYINNLMTGKVKMKLFILSQSSMAAPLKFGNGWIIPLLTF